MNFRRLSDWLIKWLFFSEHSLRFAGSWKNISLLGCVHCTYNVRVHTVQRDSLNPVKTYYLDLYFFLIFELEETPGFSEISCILSICAIQEKNILAR